MAPPSLGIHAGLPAIPLLLSVIPLFASLLFFLFFLATPHLTGTSCTGVHPARGSAFSLIFTGSEDSQPRNRSFALCTGVMGEDGFGKQLDPVMTQPAQLASYFNGQALFHEGGPTLPNKPNGRNASSMRDLSVKPLHTLLLPPRLQQKPRNKDLRQQTAH
jgi:hypothetical protein